MAEGWSRRALLVGLGGIGVGWTVGSATGARAAMTMGEGKHSAGAPLEILCFGDSLTEGYMVDASASYPALLQQRLRRRGLAHTVRNAGVSGATTGDGLLWMLEPAAARRPDLVILALGTNDAFMGVPPAEVEANLEAIILRFAGIGAKVILAAVRLPSFLSGEYGRRYHDIFPRLAEKYRLPLIPSFLEGVEGVEELNMEDRIHPLPEGYRLILKNVWRVLAPELGEKE
ncbi:MAG: arylesterase [Magnetococcales bacterium]|nr:arylesterase [Magnetococcales bacterium]